MKPFKDAIEKTLYGKWTKMRDRVRNPNNKRYHAYGGRGISICERWNSFAIFQNDMRPTYKIGLSIDRIDNNGNYCPENCRWATEEQQKSNMRSNRWIEFQGKRLTVRQWEKEKGWNRYTLDRRLKEGWSIERALTTPIDIKQSSRLRTTAFKKDIFNAVGQSEMNLTNHPNHFEDRR